MKGGRGNLEYVHCMADILYILKTHSCYAVFAAPKEDLKDWPEDHGKHPQKGVAK